MTDPEFHDTLHGAPTFVATGGDYLDPLPVRSHPVPSPIEEGIIGDAGEAGLDRGPDGRPVMTRLEASFHASVADKRAELAAQQGEGETAAAAELGARALADHALGYAAVFNGVKLQRPGAMSVYAVQAMQEIFAEAALLPLDNTALLIHAFAAPRAAYEAACVLRDREALLRAARELAVRLDDAETIEAASEWCQEAFARLNGVKKPSGPAATAPAQQTRAGQPPRANGSKPSPAPPTTMTAAAAPGSRP
jgi:hypothetical protein